MEKGKISILIVDDEEMNRDMLSRRLAKEDYITQVAESGREALAMLDIEQFDIVLLDIMMPGMDGLQVLDTIKANPKHAQTPIIMLTAMKERETVIDCIRRGASDFVTKPFDFPALKIRIWKCLPGEGLPDRSVPAEMTVQTRILAVDDNEMNLDLLVRRLGRFGYSVETATDGEQAIAKAGQEEYDLIMLDIKMPVRDGLTALKSLKADMTTADIPVVMVTATNDRKIMNECYAQGAANYVVKPYNSVVLLARIEPIIKARHLQRTEREKQAHLDSMVEVGRSLRTE